jgi:hypothetical protein
MSARWRFLGGALLASGCSLPPRTVKVRVELPAGLANDGKRLAVLPRIAEVQRQVARGVVALELKRAPVRLELSGACPLSIDTRAASTSVVGELELRPLVDAGPSERIVGLGERFTIRALPNCPEADAARISLSVTGGAGLEQPQISRDGRELSATTRTTLPMNSAVPGIVAVSAAEQRRLRSEVTLRVELAGGGVYERVLGVSAVARSSGLPNVGLSHPLLISGKGFVLEQRPPESQALLRALHDVFELRPDVPGKYRLKDSAGHELSIQSGRYDQTQLDCGRGDCHAAIAKSATKSPMTQALASDLGGCHSLENPECATACHTTGEPGTADGGFSHVAEQLGLSALPSDYDELPASLRRVGGVGCMACHGPAAIPEPSARWAIMRSDVCAVCHDAPPRYGHVQALQTSRMAHADRDRAARNDAACARCHTSWGAVGRPAPPHDVPGFGLTCSTCHAVHAPGAEKTTEHGLLRAFPIPSSLPNPPPSFTGMSQVCVSCHAPSSTSTLPEASAAALIAGQGGLEPTTGEPLAMLAPHAGGLRGCLGCHDSGPDELVLGKSHGFRASMASCSKCHSSPKTRDPSIRTRALTLLAKLDPERAAPSEQPFHATRSTKPKSIGQQRALYDVLLVLEDPAADIHHPVYATSLLDAAERVTPGASR